MSTQVHKCNCKHDQQDKIYGQNMRLHNLTQKKEARCTVCGSTKK